MTLALAFDRATGSVRRLDADGRLHISSAVLTTACVSNYRGDEIPQWQRFGLNANEVYPLLRPAEELEKAVATFNALPVLSQHVPVDAVNHEMNAKLVVGSTGSDAEFDGSHLRNSLVIWSAPAIKAVESGERADLSCGYRFQAVMQPGTFRGERFSGRMVDLVGNHLALVAEGRVSSAVIGDAAMSRFGGASARAIALAPGLARIQIGVI